MKIYSAVVYLIKGENAHNLLSSNPFSEVKAFISNNILKMCLLFIEDQHVNPKNQLKK